MRSIEEERVVTRPHSVTSPSYANHDELEMHKSQTSPDSMTEAVVSTRKPRSTLRMLLVLIALYLALFIAALDQTIITTA